MRLPLSNPIWKTNPRLCQAPQRPSSFTWRSIITGMLLGGVLSLCNLYVGLKIGWGIGMSLIAALLAILAMLKG